MSTNIVMGILLILHVLACLAVYLCYRNHVLKLDKISMPVVILIPLWGVLCVILLNIGVITVSKRKKEFGIEKMQVNEEIYKNIFLNTSRKEKEVVPLEEALIINTPSQRRKLIMDMLYDNPEDYIELFYEARLNDDVEVVHYATTAMTELSKEYDIEIQKMEHDYAKNPDDEKVLNAYCELLEKYLSLGLAQGQSLLMQRNQYEQLLEKRVELHMNKTDLIHMAENEMELQDYGKAARTIQIMEEKWPDEEKVWLLKLKYFALQKAGTKIQKLLAEIKEKQIYISKSGQEKIEFWSKKQEVMSGEME